MPWGDIEQLRLIQNQSQKEAESSKGEMQDDDSAQPVHSIIAAIREAGAFTLEKQAVVLSHVPKAFTI